MKTAIRVENLSKVYRLGEIGTGTISHDFERWFKTKVLSKEDPFLKIGQTKIKDNTSTNEYVYSLNNINFDIKQGEAVGIIGRNGAGKSTLLKILSRVTSPTSGFIKTNGRIASLLEVGTGFHPELTGRENIYLNGAILGMRKFEITKKLDEIIDFSGVERYIDTPVKRYSSGMYVRLAFAVAAHLESEVLIVDEVLAVGDAEFQKKCLGKMGDITKSDGRTILFVSHNISAINALCNKGILLEKGMIKSFTNIQNVINQYYFSDIIGQNNIEISKYRNYKIDNSPIVIKQIYIENKNQAFPILSINEAFTIIIKVEVFEEIKNANITISFTNSEGIITDLAFSWDDNYYLNIKKGIHEIRFTPNNISLSPNRYSINVGINQHYNTNAWDGVSEYPLFEIENINAVVNWVNRKWAAHHSFKNNWSLKY